MAQSASLVRQAEEYFAFRRRLGFRPGSERDEVLQFARLVDARRIREITLETVVDWARNSPRGHARYIAMRYEHVRRFLTRIASARSGITVPPPGYLSGPRAKVAVHIYTPEEVRSLMTASLELEPTRSLRPHTHATLFGLLDAVGLRVGEALALDVTDVDLQAGTVHVRRDKLGGTRLLPLHATTVDALKDYSARRRRRHKAPKSPAFFLTESRGTRLQYQTAFLTFRILRKTLGWRQPPRPRLHDLRHTFAVRKLLEWMRAGKDVDVEMPALSAYLGHSKPRTTYWYLSAVPELCHLITGRMDQLERLRPGTVVI